MQLCNAPRVSLLSEMFSLEDSEADGHGGSSSNNSNNININNNSNSNKKRSGNRCDPHPEHDRELFHEWEGPSTGSPWAARQEAFLPATEPEQVALSVTASYSTSPSSSFGIPPWSSPMVPPPSPPPEEAHPPLVLFSRSSRSQPSTKDLPVLRPRNALRNAPPAVCPGQRIRRSSPTEKIRSPPGGLSRDENGNNQQFPQQQQQQRQEEQQARAKSSCPETSLSLSLSLGTLAQEYEKDTLRMLERIQKSRSFEQTAKQKKQDLRPGNCPAAKTRTRTPTRTAPTSFLQHPQPPVESIASEAAPWKENRGVDSQKPGDFYIGDEEAGDGFLAGGHAPAQQPQETTLLLGPGGVGHEHERETGEDIFELDL
ncbi:unnamed protein product [Pseudo-nitzschia multistriata]|uniref:Uncharacterized protein n=1 Tax=Pseudo-nitzschia multistriata TaxID=183589 RepID=A0A448Z290_9STRA|nr:unnamed protein product [Pseudo-nitzschia multistriata]